ncbi:MAG TPA: glycosyltransferase family 2 protein, partial [Planctomycetota bacterium]|nr:glycosyltransferase family 2 protein [Planctomycetota bacterium]
MAVDPIATPRRTLCVVSPCYNEAAGIRLFYESLKAVLEAQSGLEHTILFVDDGSTDATLSILDALAASDPRVLVYSLSRNFGHQVALSAGIDVARADGLILMDSDLQHPPELIPALVARWRAGADVVSAVRSCTADASLFKRLSTSAFYGIINRISETRIVPDAADFVLLSRNAHEAILRMPERHRFLRGMVSWIGFRREFVEYRAPARRAGESSYTLRRMLRLGADALFSFSAAPVRLATRVGMLAVVCGLLYLAYILFMSFFHPEKIQPGWSSIISVVLILCGLQIVF